MPELVAADSLAGGVHRPPVGPASHHAGFSAPVPSFVCLSALQAPAWAAVQLHMQACSGVFCRTLLPASPVAGQGAPPAHRLGKKMPGDTEFSDLNVRSCRQALRIVPTGAGRVHDHAAAAQPSCFKEMNL